LVLWFLSEISIFVLVFLFDRQLIEHPLGWRGEGPLESFSCWVCLRGVHILVDNFHLLKWMVLQRDKGFSALSDRLGLIIQFGTMQHTV